MYSILSVLRPMLRQYTCVEIANLNVILLGLSAVWPSPMVIKLKEAENPILSRPITDDEAAWVASIALLTGLSAMSFSGTLMNKLGRKTTILCSYIPRFLFCLFSIFATEYWMILLARTFAGMADLLCMSVVSTYASEISNKEIRGQTGTMTQINSAVGMLIMFGLGPFVSYLTINILMTCLVAVSLVPLMILPESPFFLYTKGQTSRSMEVLTFLHGTEELAQIEYNEYTKKNSDAVVSKRELFKYKVIIKTFVMVVLLCMGLQLIGYNTVNFYLQTIFESANTTVSSEISSLIIGVIQLLACVCTFFLTDRFKRKTILCTSLVGMFIGMIGLGTFFTVMENGVEIKGFLNYMPLISAAIVIYGYNAGMGSLFWMLIAEILYGPVRAYGMSLGVFVATLTGFSISLVFPIMTRAIGAGGVYWIFSGFSALTCLLIAVFVPETKGRTFAEVQTALGRKGSMFIDSKDKE